MYKSPIEIIAAGLQRRLVEQEDIILEEVFSNGVKVDKDELIKALQYDRGQYDKGYRDGRNSVLQKLREIMEEEI